MKRFFIFYVAVHALFFWSFALADEEYKFDLSEI